MKLTQLDYVVAAQRSGSFSQGARDCGITQAALSNAVATLEDELGERIFARSNVRLSLTPFGVQLLPLIESVLAARDKLSKDVASLQAPSSRRMLVGHSPLISSTLLRRLVPVLRAAVARANVGLTEGNMGDLHERLKLRTIDLAIVPRGPPSKAFRSLELETEPLSYLPPGTAAALGLCAPRQVALRDIADQIFLMVPDACGLAWNTRRLFSSTRRKLRSYEEQAMSYRSLEEWASTGLGAAILPQSKVTDPDRALLLLLKEGKPAEICYEAIWHRDNSRRLQPFIRALRLSWTRGRFRPGSED
jgi:LysR family hydrogen peroxide-inducible transcriptional activator